MGDPDYEKVASRIAAFLLEHQVVAANRAAALVPLRSGGFAAAFEAGTIRRLPPVQVRLEVRRRPRGWRIGAGSAARRVWLKEGAFFRIDLDGTVTSAPIHPLPSAGTVARLQSRVRSALRVTRARLGRVLRTADEQRGPSRPAVGLSCCPGITWRVGRVDVARRRLELEAWDRGGIFDFNINTEGVVLPPQVPGNYYADAFAAEVFAWKFEETGEPVWLEASCAALDFVARVYGGGYSPAPFIWHHSDFKNAPYVEAVERLARIGVLTSEEIAARRSLYARFREDDYSPTNVSAVRFAWHGARSAATGADEGPALAACLDRLARDQTKDGLIQDKSPGHPDARDLTYHNFALAFLVRLQAPGAGLMDRPQAPGFGLEAGHAVTLPDAHRPQAPGFRLQADHAATLPQGEGSTVRASERQATSSSATRAALKERYLKPEARSPEPDREPEARSPEPDREPEVSSLEPLFLRGARLSLALATPSGEAAYVGRGANNVYHVACAILAFEGAARMVDAADPDEADRFQAAARRLFDSMAKWQQPDGSFPTAMNTLADRRVAWNHCATPYNALIAAFLVQAAAVQRRSVIRPKPEAWSPEPASVSSRRSVIRPEPEAWSLEPAPKPEAWSLKPVLCNDAGYAVLPGAGLHAVIFAGCARSYAWSGGTHVTGVAGLAALEIDGAPPLLPVLDERVGAPDALTDLPRLRHAAPFGRAVLRPLPGDTPGVRLSHTYGRVRLDRGYLFMGNQLLVVTRMISVDGTSPVPAPWLVSIQARRDEGWRVDAHAPGSVWVRGPGCGLHARVLWSDAGLPAATVGPIVTNPRGLASLAHLLAAPPRMRASIVTCHVLEPWAGAEPAPADIHVESTGPALRISIPGAGTAAIDLAEWDLSP